MRFRSLLAAVPAALALAACVGASPGPAGARPDACPWMDTSKTPQQRATELLAAMSLDDKVLLTYQNDAIWTYYGVAGHVAGNAAQCRPDLVLNDAGQGVG